MPALIGLLVVVFVIAGVIVREARITMKVQGEMAERGLQDCVAYASWMSRADQNWNSVLSDSGRGA